MTKRVYLAGPMAGLNYENALKWRKEFAAMMPTDIVALSPMRGKEYLKEVGILTSTTNGYREHILSSDRAVVARDRNDCMTSDAVVFNFLGAKIVSVGTCIEIGWADAARVPMILIMEPKCTTYTNPHEHVIIRGTCGFHTKSLEEAALVTRALLSDEYARKNQ